MPLRRANANISSGSRLPSTWMCSSHLGSRVIKASVSCMSSKGDYPTPPRFRQLVSFALTRIIRSGEHKGSLSYPAGNPVPRYDLEHIPVVLTHFVIAGLDPAIHPLRKKFLRRMMDPRVKPAGDACGCGMQNQTNVL